MKYMFCVLVVISVLSYTIRQGEAFVFSKFSQAWKIRIPSPSIPTQIPTSSSSRVPLSSKVSSVYEDEDEDVYDHLRNEFSALSKGETLIDFNTIVNWQEIQALVADKLVTVDELQTFFVEATKDGSAQGQMDVNEFIEFNRMVDDLFELEDDEEEGDEYLDDPNSALKLDINKDDDEYIRGEIQYISDDPDSSDFEVWDSGVEANSLFLPDFLTYLTDFFNAHAIDGLLTFKPFAQWNDVKQMIREGRMDPSSLRDLWVEALRFENNVTDLQSLSLADKEERRRIFEERGISLDAFIRLNFRLEEVLEDIKEALEDLSDLDVESYYKKEFDSLSGSSGTTKHRITVTYEQFMQWDAVQDLLEHGDVSREALDALWRQAMDKEPPNAAGIGLPSFVWINDQINESLGKDENHRQYYMDNQEE